MFFGVLARREAGEAEAGGETSGSGPEPSATQPGAEPDPSRTRGKDGTEESSKPAAHEETLTVTEDEGKTGAEDVKSSEPPTETDSGFPEAEKGLDTGHDPTAQPGEGAKVPFDPNPKSVPISEFEVLFIERLSVHMTGSPRRAKRFVNLYRLIKMSLPESRLATLVGPSGDSLNYKILLIHLAIITAARRPTGPGQS